MSRGTIAIGATGVALGLAGCLSPKTIRKIEGTPGQEGTGIMLSRLPAVIKILATHPATDEQRQVAEARAKAAQAQLKAGDKAGVPRYLAVDTEPDERSLGKVSVMIWDTHSEEIVGNEVYDVEEPPELGDLAMWQTFSAQYVGVGETL